MIVQPIGRSISQPIAVGVGTGGGGGPAGNPLPAFQVGDVNYVHPTGSAGTNYDGAIPNPAVASGTLAIVKTYATALDGLLTGTLPIAGLTSLTTWWSYGNPGITGTFDVSGCTSLTDLRVQYCGHSGSFSALPASIVQVLCGGAGGNQFSGAIPDFDKPNFEQFVGQYNAFTSWAGTVIPASCYNLNIEANALDLATVNSLVDAAFTRGWGAGGETLRIDGGTNATPGAAQIVKIDAMILAGANIQYNA